MATLTFMSKVCSLGFETLVEPIEQNVSGSNGLYELMYFERDSRPIDRFQKAGAEQERFVKTSTENGVEKLVHTLVNDEFLIVLEDFEAQCSSLWS